MVRKCADVSRRQVLQGVCGAAVLAAVGNPAEAANIAVKSSRVTGSGILNKISGLRPIVEPKGKNYGAAVMSHHLGETDFANALKRECNMLVPESELKMSWVRPTPDTFNWAGYHKLADFARNYNMKLRGHTLIWHEAMPQWAKDTLSTTADPMDFMVSHISTMMRYTQGMIGEWDVVNEAIDHDSPRGDKLRITPWLNAVGDNYIAEAFKAAATSNPSAKLVYNDYGLEYDNPWTHKKRRKAVLDLLTKLRNQDVPIHSLGLQAHLVAHQNFDTGEYTNFLQNVKDLGIEIMITELDVNTSQLRMSNTKKAQKAGEHLQRYLDIVRSVTNVQTLLTWGLSVRHCWMLQQDSAAYGGLPLDNNMNRLPVWNGVYDGWAKFDS